MRIQFCGGPRTVTGSQHLVRRQVKTMDHFSGHADQNELPKYVGFNPPERLEHVFLVHEKFCPATTFEV